MVTLFFGGAGLLAYLVLAVALPEDDGTGQPVPESVWSRLGKVVLVCVLVAVGLFLAAGLAVVSAWVTATGHGTVIAIAVIVFGLGLVAAAFAGDIRRRIVPLLVVAGIVLGIPAAAVAAADINIDESIGQRTYTPTVAADIPADGYRLGTGQLIVDLRQLPWQKRADDSGLGPPRDRADDRLRPAQRLHRWRRAREGGELIAGGQVTHGVDPDIDQGSPLTDAPTAQGQRRYPVRADADHGRGARSDRHPAASTTTTTSRKRTPRGRSAGGDPPTVRRPDSSALGAGISILALGVFCFSRTGE